MMTFLRLLLLSSVAIMFAPAAANAGDTARVHILGFSADGGVFAFEEYGIQDGSGFPYASRFYIDTETDTFLPGTPIRVRLEDEAATLLAARAEARDRGQEIIPDTELAENRGFTAGWNAVTELSADPHRIVVNPRPVIPPIDSPVAFRIEEIHVQQPEDCENLGPVMGFRLTRIALEPGEQTVLVHEDSAIPSSRNCPLGYRIGGMQTFFPEVGAPVYALMIAIRSFGFEGPDHHWIAVTGEL